MRPSSWCFLIIGGLWVTLGTTPLDAATISANSCSYADVNAALDNAANGDTVLVPAGTCTWTQSMDFDLVITNGRNKYLTLRGAGIDQTVIIDGVSKAPYPNIPYLLRWTTVNGGLTRITGFTFRGGSNVDGYNQGMIYIRGNSQQFRFDNNKVIPTKTSGMFIWDNVTGVLDHNVFDVSVAFGLYTFHNSWLNVGGYGDNSWATPNTFGTQQAIFIEDNTFTNNQSVVYHDYAVDGWSGGRVVYRYNTFNNCTWANHGTESSGRHRSQRQFEIYNNTWTWNMKGNGFASMIGARGGVGVVFNNTATITNGTVNNFFDVSYYRAGGSFAPWGQCPNSWDLSSSACLDQTGRGDGDLISGDTPSPVRWPNQAADPTYVWNNKINGTVSPPASHSSAVVVGRDILSQARPGYTPYQYPHPLITAGTNNAAPTAPKNLTVQ